MPPRISSPRLSQVTVSANLYQPFNPNLASPTSTVIFQPSPESHQPLPQPSHPCLQFPSHIPLHFTPIPSKHQPNPIQLPNSPPQPQSPQPLSSLSAPPPIHQPNTDKIPQPAHAPRRPRNCTSPDTRRKLPIPH
ncbi:hypothetical protein K469DRAFT_715120 [Zopfia rhizophila CBS 207.26]|uniref:Uncharacterized protein n=1 Tax=Zopfia rhizophila CBS 207.26 TaxID=1314779 RepID=A0A6A6EPX4_9PEZI|nr:hypothetical protein K469DRAFT_715120 [Zopfia rhizophila CBS 207.26]